MNTSALTGVRLFVFGALVILVEVCGSSAALPISAGIGPTPTLPDPQHSLIPLVNVAAVSRWPAGTHPDAAPGLSVTAFAGGLEHPRWLYVLPNVDVLVAETNAPPRPDDATNDT